MTGQLRRDEDIDMRFGLVSFQCENGNVSFNMRQIERALRENEGKVDVLCFGEAFLQGFDSLCWDYDTDKMIALERSSGPIGQLIRWTVEYGTALIIGYLEKDGDRLYSSCIVIADGEVVHNYRRISKGWKEYTKTDCHYCEGTDTGPFRLHGKDMKLALCGDLWEFPERFQTEHLLIWPVYVNYSTEEWNGGALDEYAAQAAAAAKSTLMINSIDREPVCHGGSFLFQDGRVVRKIPFDEERVLIVDVE